MFFTFSNYIIVKVNICFQQDKNAKFFGQSQLIHLPEILFSTIGMVEIKQKIKIKI